MILSSGRLWDEAKTVSAITGISAQLSWPVYLAAEYRREMEISSRSSSLGIFFLTLFDWMSRALIFSLPARYEPFGYATLEAAYSGCARVLGDIPSLRENWDGAAGVRQSG